MRLNSDGSPISIGPAVEFVRVDFCRPEDLTPGNVTLANLGADQFILGEMSAWDSFDFTALADIDIELKRDGEVILTTSPSILLVAQSQRLIGVSVKRTALDLRYLKGCCSLGPTEPRWKRIQAITKSVTGAGYD